MLPKELLLAYILSFMGAPYKYGVLDCSGFVIEILQADGEFPRDEDATAQGLYVYFKDKGYISTRFPSLRCLAFYGKSVNKIEHVGYCIDKDHIAEAGGGDSTTNTDQEAYRRNAKARISPILYRKDLVDILVPNDNILRFKKLNSQE